MAINSGKGLRDWIDQMMPVSLETVSTHEAHVITRLLALGVIHHQFLPLQLLEKLLWRRYRLIEWNAIYCHVRNMDAKNPPFARLC